MAKFASQTKEIIVLCGPPGCGKDHYIGQLPKGYYAVSFEDYVEIQRKEIGCPFEEAWRNPTILRRAETHQIQTIESYMKSGVNVVWNSMNLGRKKRELVMKMIPEGYIKHVVVWELAPAELQRRHKKRFEDGGKNVDWDLVETMLQHYTTPVFDEGWDVISVRKV